MGGQTKKMAVRGCRYDRMAAWGLVEPRSSTASPVLRHQGRGEETAGVGGLHAPCARPSLTRPCGLHGPPEASQIWVTGMVLSRGMSSGAKRFF